MAEKALGNNTYEDYLALEAESDVKYEFHDGFILAMAGGTPEHAEIAVNFTWALKNALKQANKPCRVLSSDAKVYVEAVNRSYYPDATVVCGKKEISEKDPRAIINPTLVLEVLSESTAAFDRGEKFAHYRQLPTLREYVIINPQKPRVETYYRNEVGLWDIQEFTQLADMILLKSLACQVSVGDIYDMMFEEDDSIG